MFILRTDNLSPQISIPLTDIIPCLHQNLPRPLLYSFPYNPIFKQFLSIQTIIIISPMGLTGSKSNDLFAQLLKRYKVVRTNPSQNLTYLQDLNQDGQDCLCRQIVVNDKTIFEQKLKEIEEKQKLLQNPHVVRLSQYKIAEQKEYCGIYHKIYILFEYPHRTLEEEIIQRIAQRSKFQEKQLWSIIASCILGLSHLQKSNILHQSISSKNILIDNKGSVKIADPFCTMQPSNYSKILNKSKTEHIYLSPELCECLNNAEITPTSQINPYRSDVFSFGMVIIEAALLKYLDDCYREERTKIDWDTIRYYLDQIEQSYGVELKQFVERLVSDTGKRPDWNELKLHMKDDGKSSGKNSQVPQGNQSQHQYQHQQQVTQQQQQSQIQIKPNQQHPLPPYSTIPLIDNRPHTHHLHLGGAVTQEYRPVSHLIPAQGSPKHVSDYAVTRPPPVYVTNQFNPPPPQPQPLPSHHTSSSYIEITPIQASNINFVRPVLGTRPADSYITHTKIDQNLVEVSDDQDEIQTNEGDSSNPNRPFNPNATTTVTHNTSTNSRPYAPPTIDSHQVGNIGSTPYHNNVPYHSSGFRPNPVIVSSGHTSPKNQVISNSDFIQPSRYISNIPVGAGLPHHSPVFNRPVSNIPLPHHVVPNQATVVGSYKPIDTNSLFTDYEKLGIKKSDPNIAGITTQSYYSKIEVPSNAPSSYAFNRPTSQHQVTRNPPLTQLPTQTMETQRVVETFSQGSRYQGEKVNGMRHGKGRFYYQDGGLYDGEWRQNKMCGKGKLFYQSGKIAYDGNWQNDQFTGFGILYNQQPQQLTSTYNYDNFNDMQEVWTKYEGYFVDDKKQGDGKLYFSNGEYYEGKFDDDVVNGRGVFYKMDGGRVKGEWKDNYLVETMK